MSLASSSAAAPDGAKIDPSFVPSTTHAQARQRWWRSLWSRRDGRFFEIRHMMLGQLAAVIDTDQRSALAAKIQTADQPEALWALRQDLMQALVGVHGEMLARRRLTDITFMFAGLLDRERHTVAGPEGADDEADWPRAAAARDATRNAEHLHADH